MDSQALVISPDLALGERVAETLSRDGELDLRACIWWLGAGESDLRLLIATPLYDSLGPLKTHLRINQLLLEGNVEVPPSTIWATSPHHAALKMLRSVIGEGKGSFRDCIFNGMYVPYVYIHLLRHAPKRKAGVTKRTKE